MNDPRTKRHWHTKSEAEWCQTVRQCGEDGLAVTEASQRLGINTNTFARWERVHRAFGEAATLVRKNSAERALNRTKRLLDRSEERLLQALERVRAEKVAEFERIRLAMEAMGHGSDWGPHKLAEKVANLKELRLEADIKRQRERKHTSAPGVRRRKLASRAREVTIQTVQYALVPTAKQ